MASLENDILTDEEINELRILINAPDIGLISSTD